VTVPPAIAFLLAVVLSGGYRRVELIGRHSERSNWRLSPLRR
jgi:hypothetical protein